METLSAQHMALKPGQAEPERALGEGVEAATRGATPISEGQSCGGCCQFCASTSWGEGQTYTVLTSPQGS